jgi:hypothetical protein
LPGGGEFHRMKVKTVFYSEKFGGHTITLGDRKYIIVKVLSRKQSLFFWLNCFTNFTFMKIVEIEAVFTRLFPKKRYLN